MKRAKHRHTELDGLRGIASVAVGLHHGLGAILASATLAGTLITAALIPAMGAFGVDLFFIMSGFFLTGMVEHAARLPVFYLRRFIRLVPPALVSALVLFVFTRLALSTPPIAAESAQAYLQYYAACHLMPLRLVLLNLALIRHALNPPLWTIRLELLTSALFPLIIWLKNLRPSAAHRLVLLAALLLIALLLNHHKKFGLDVLHYLYIFYAGTLIHDLGPRLKLSTQQQYALFALAIIGLLAAAAFSPDSVLHRLRFDMPATLCGGTMVLLLAHGNLPAIKRFMNLRLVQFLGRISYSFYLLNWLAVAGIGGLLMHSALPAQAGMLPCVLLLTFLSTLLSVLLGYLLHICVERPATALSRHVA